MKKLLIVCLIGVLLVSCGSQSKASVSKQTSSIDTDPYKIVGKEDFGGYDVYKFKDKETGCYYLYAYNSSVTQMFVEDKFGDLKPYCD